MTIPESYRHRLDAMVKHMVDRFLGWKLPEDFAPDAGISFDIEKCRYGPNVYFPIGTNLFTATQAEAMIRHLLDGMPSEAVPVKVGHGLDDSADMVRRYLLADMDVGSNEAWDHFCDLMANFKTEIEDYHRQLDAKDCRIAELERQLEEADKALIQALPWDPGARAHPYECAWVVSRQFESNCGPKPCNCWLSKADEAIARQEARKKESPNGPHN